jgi:hypothetical protein
MSVRFSELVVDCRDAAGLAAFWQRVLGWETAPTDEDDEVGLAGPGDVPDLLFVPVPEGKAVKNRLHIDVSPVGTSRDEEVTRILALGATRADVGQGDDVSWVVLADPEGNEFCVLRGTSS